MAIKLDRYTMAFQIAMVTKYSDEYLLSLTDKELETLYKEKVEHNDKIQS